MVAAGLAATVASAARLAWSGLGVAALALLARFLMVGNASLTYNEATYVELATHPWYSSFYPDQLFVRHPPLAFLVMWAWNGVFGTAEWVVRLPGLAMAWAGIALLWWSVRRTMGELAAAMVGILAAASFPLHAYLLQATMYPLAFLCAAGAVHAHLLGHRTRELVWTTLLALTHLFGFLFLAVWLWRNRTAWLHFVRVVWPAGVWLLAATVAGLLLNREGDVIRLGPVGQAVRGGATAGDALWARTWVHVASAALAVLALHPVLLAGAWSARRHFAAWAAALAVLVPYFFIGAPYPRYAAIVIPFAWAAGLWAWLGPGRPDSPRWMRRPATALVVLVLGVAVLPLGFAYLEHGPDPRAAGDVPGVQEWQPALRLVPADAATIATSGPTSTAYYLMEEGHRVVDRSAAPYEIRLDGVTVWRLDAPADVAAAASLDPDAWIVPSHWDITPPAPRCGSVQGLVVFARAC